MKNHVMIDFETLGVSQFPVLLSVGAVVFDPWEQSRYPGHGSGEEGGVIGRSPVPGILHELAHGHIGFFSYVSIESCQCLGAKIDPDTLAWWMAPEQAEARPHAFWDKRSKYPAPLHAITMLNELALWLRSASHRAMDELVFWSHGSIFDIQILLRYMAELNFKSDIRYRNIRDTRTFFDFLGDRTLGPNNYKTEWKNLHHPTWDAWNQARAVQHIIAMRGVPEFPQ